MKAGDSHVFHAFLHDITERRQSAQFLASAAAITTVLPEEETVEEAIPQLLRALGEGMGWEFGAFWTVGERSVLRCRETWTVSGLDLSSFEAATRASSSEPGVGLPGRVWASERPAFIPNLAGFDAVKIEEIRFEDWAPEPEPFDLVFAATSWHWSTLVSVTRRPPKL